MSVELAIYRFGEFELNPAESSLRQAGIAIPITPKALNLLSILVENQGHVLDKEYLLDQIWGDSFVEEGNLTFNIRQIRKILGDDAKKPKYIETVPKRGYRFIGNVEKEAIGKDETASSNEVSPVIIKTERRSRKRSAWSPWVLSIPIILAAGGIAAVESWIGVFGPKTTSPTLLTTPFSSERLSTDGDVFYATLAKSGDFVVYVAGSPNEKQSLRIRDLSTGQSREMLEASESQYYGLDISNDDSTVYFVRTAPGNAGKACLFRMNLIGGVPESLACGMEGWFDISNDSGSITFVRCTYGIENICSLYIADGNGKNERLLVTRKRPIRITDNAISPDGRKVVFAAGQSIDGSDDFGIYALDLETGEESAVVDQKFFNIVGIDWMPDGNSLLATALLTNDHSICFWSVDPVRPTATPVKPASEFYKGLSLLS